MSAKRTNILNAPPLSGIIAAALISLTCLSSTSATAEVERNKSAHMLMMMTAPHANGLSMMSTMKIARLMNRLNAQTAEVSASNALDEVETRSENLVFSQDRHRTAYVIARANGDIHNLHPENK